jgi:hypothetical protein
MYVLTLNQLLTEFNVLCEDIERIISCPISEREQLLLDTHEAQESFKLIISFLKSQCGDEWWGKRISVCCTIDEGLCENVYFDETLLKNTIQSLKNNKIPFTYLSIYDNVLEEEYL